MTQSTFHKSAAENIKIPPGSVATPREQVVDITAVRIRHGFQCSTKTTVYFLNAGIAPS